MKKVLKILCLTIIILLGILSTYKYATQTNKINILAGDVDRSNSIDRKDAEIILEKIANEKTNNENESIISGNLQLADINSDDQIDIVDALAVIRYEKAKTDGELNKHPEWITRLEQEVEFGIENEEIVIDLSEQGTKGNVELQGNNYGNVTYSIENEEIATVNGSGIITGKRNGETTITASEDKGNLKSSVKVIVQTSPNQIELNKSTLVLDLSGTKEENLIATISPNTANINTEIKWTSSNTSIATVSNSGVVTGITNGEATITATTVNGETKTCKVIVQTSPEQIKINKNILTLDLSETKEDKLTATISPDTANINTEITWSSSNREVAIVDNGKIIGVGNGKAIIAASTENKKIAICEVTVETSPIEVVLNKSKTTLDLNSTKTEQLLAIVNPETANINKVIRWESSDTKIVTVDKGLVTGVSEGEATITAITENGKEAKCTVVVVKEKIEILPEKIELNETVVTLDLSETKTKRVTATISPETANTNTEITWTSSNKSIATVNNSGVVTGIANGEATITAITGNGKIATCKVTVQTSPTQISMNKTSLTLDLSGTKSATLTGTISPSTANKNMAVTWTSSNTNVATVENGIVTGKANGIATITVKTGNGKIATCKVTVQTSPTQIQLSSKKNFLSENETELLTITMSPSTANKNTAVTWKSSNTSVATVNDNGEVKRVGVGKTTITATTANGKVANIDMLCGGKYIDFTDESMKMYTFVKDFVVSGNTSTLNTGESNSMPQCFDIVQYNSGNYVFFTQHTGLPADYVTLTKSEITGINSNGLASLKRLSCMRLYQFGHGGWLSIEVNKSKSRNVCLDVK